MKNLTPVPHSDQGLQLLQPMANNHAPPAPKFRPYKLLLFLRKFWWIPVITTSLGLAAAVFMFYHMPPVFISAGSLWETEKLHLPQGASFSDDDDSYLSAQTYLGTQSELLRSQMLRDLTLNRMRALATNQIIYDKQGSPLAVDIEVSSSLKSSVYTVVATSANPAFTKNYLNNLMAQYLEYRKNIRQQVSENTLTSISDQVQRLESDMKADQEKLDEYEKSNNLAVLEQESTTEATYLLKLKTELSDFQLDMQMLAARELDANSGPLTATNDSDTIFASLRDSPASSASDRLDAEKQIALLQADRDRLSKYLLPKHPKIVRLDKDIAHAQKLLDISSRQNHEQIVAARQALQIKIDTVQQFITEWEGKVADSTARIATADGFKQAVNRNQGMYDRLSSLLQNVDISRNIDQETLAILEGASPSKRSYTEAKSRLSKFGILGLGLGLGIVFLLAFRDDRFNSLVEVTERFGDNVVGQVPEIPEFSKTAPLALLDINDDRHMYAESYRNLRSALLYLAVDGHRPKLVVITSAVPNEGKSTIATNLARALALGGSKVLLIDGDLRKGRIHEALKLPSKPGFSDLLRQPDDPEKFIQATDLPGFSFIARGGINRNPGDLLLSPAVDQLLAAFREQYDYVLIDSSPVFAADDTSTIAPKVDGVLFVVRSRFSHGRVVREALEILFQRQARVLGLILNRSDPSPNSYYYYKYAEYYSTDNAVEADKVS